MGNSPTLPAKSMKSNGRSFRPLPPNITGGTFGDLLEVGRASPQKKSSGFGLIRNRPHVKSPACRRRRCSLICFTSSCVRKLSTWLRVAFSIGCACYSWICSSLLERQKHSSSSDGLPVKPTGKTECILKQMEVRGDPFVDI